METQIRRQIKEAVRTGAPSEDIYFLNQRLQKYIEEHGEDALARNEHHWTMGFSHLDLPVITADKFDEIQFFKWGLIPFWVKDKAYAKRSAGNCLNAKSETFFELPSFRAAAKARRCVIPLSGYYEHHWVDSKGKNIVPYIIRHKSNKPLFMAGLWESWVDTETGEEVKTCSIITTRAEGKTALIHNRKPNDPRMLVILPFEDIADWLSPVEDQADKDLIKSLCVAYPDELLESHSVPQLRGKSGVGDVPEAAEPFDYNYIGIP